MIVEIEGVLVEVTQTEQSGQLQKFNIIIGQTSKDRVGVEKKRIYCITFLMKEENERKVFAANNRIGDKIKVKAWLHSNRSEKDGKVMFFNNVNFLQLIESGDKDKKPNVQESFYGNTVSDTTDDLPF